MGDFIGNGRGWVPIDDHTTMAFCYLYRPDRPLSDEEQAFSKSGAAFPPRTEYRPVELRDGYVIDAYDTIANKSNDFLIDREMQKTKNYTGVWGISEQDRTLIESMPWADRSEPGILDTSEELLVKSDYPIIKARRILINLARDLEKGIEPAPAHAGGCGVRAISIKSPIADFEELMEKHGELGQATVKP